MRLKCRLRGGMREKKMELSTLCREINLQPEIKDKVLDFEKNFDFKTVEQQLNDFSVYNKMEKARTELKTILGEDNDNIKILTCMLKASAFAYKTYKIKVISDEIYFSTMKCYTRFIDETYQRTGRLYFDRDWWTARQAGCHLFRIGSLEYEINRSENKIIIELHIPSNTDFSPSAVEQSLKHAKQFFDKYYAEIKNADYYCHSWLLDRQLEEMLKEKSNIISFQKRFEILNEGEADTEFIEWVFHRNAADYADYINFPEDTSLQRNIKKHLISGGVIRTARGKIKF